MILIVDDDPSVAASLSLLLKRHGHRPVVARSPEEALARIGSEPDVELVLQDMNFSRRTSGEEGLELLSDVRRLRPRLPVVLITAWGSIELAVQGVKAGAVDFLTKPWSNARLIQAIETALALSADGGDLAGEPPSRSVLDERYELGGLVGRDPAFVSVLALVGRVAPTDASVLISGESGTGKELIAEAIHRNSRRREGPFVKVNLGGISSTLFESEMFGHVRGAFTDAREQRRGRFEVAEGGTIFLDEAGEIEPSTQVKLLRVLQDRTYEVLGSSRTRSADVRVVSATNRDLAEMVARGEFREDLFYRLNLIHVRLPPLRERRGDVLLLARHFLDRFAESYSRSGLELDSNAAAWLESQTWPGNVRQLRQVLERAVLVLERDRFTAGDFRALADLTEEPARTGELPGPGTMTLDQVERAMIERSLEHYQGNITRAAEALGLSRAALYRRMRKHGIETPAAP